MNLGGGDMFRALILMLLVTGCSHSAHHLTTLNTSFRQSEARALGGGASIENSFVFDPSGEVVALHDPDATGALVLSRLRPFTKEVIMASGARFSYVLQWQDAYYMFTTAGDVYLWKSVDLRAWTLMNDGEPVLTREANGWVQIWNVGVDVDDTGVWHLLAETNEGQMSQGQVGLYALGTMTGNKMTFTKRSGHVVPGGGNPYVKWIKNKGLLVIHGQLDADAIWYTTASTYDGTMWTRKNWWIGVPGEHVCDPHAIESNGETILSVSVAQGSIYMLRSEETLEGMFH
jgi:hypothetical protein